MEDKKDFVLLIPYYDHYEDLVRSLKSLHYPAGQFDVLIVDDGSKIPLDKKKLQDLFTGMNIEVLRLTKNQGIARTLNTGLKHLHQRKDFEYIARLDCGDICHPDRFFKQVGFLNSHPDIGLLGTWCRFVNLKNQNYLYRTETIHENILKEMHSKCSFIHPTVMFRKEVLDTVGYYPEDDSYAEDYAYFWKILKRFRGSVLPQEYVTIAFSNRNFSSKNYKRQLISRIKIIRRFGDSHWRKLYGIFILFCKLMTPGYFIKKLKYRQ